MLKLINGVMRPEERRPSRPAAGSPGLIATGAGFHPQLTGRENIFLNAAVLGMTEAETRRKFDDIAGFAELGKFLDSPVGHYSSGMGARLGFSIAIHVDSDIFLADEVLAVGDKPFKEKCLEKMQEIRQSGRTLVYVSHAAGSVRKMCDRVIVLEKGKRRLRRRGRAGIRYVKYDSGKETEKSSAEDESSARTSRARSALEPIGAHRLSARDRGQVATGVRPPASPALGSRPDPNYSREVS